LGRTLVADSVNPIPATRDAWVGAAGRAAARAIEIEIVCSNLNEHRRRVEERVIDVPGLATPSWDEVICRDYRERDRPHVVVDTAGASVGISVAYIIEAMSA
jgi:hypothetical protein